MKTELNGAWLERGIVFIEWFVAACLVVLAALGAIGVILAMWNLAAGGVTDTAARVTAALDATLMVFIIAELFRIALAYIRHESVIPTVLEAAFVAVARKLVILDSHVPAQDLLMKAIAYAVLMLAVGVAWYLLGRTDKRLVAEEPPTTP